MINAVLIRQVLDKMLKGETVKSARIQVKTSDGVYHDIKSMRLMEIEFLVLEKVIELSLRLFLKELQWVE